MTLAPALERCTIAPFVMNRANFIAEEKQTNRLVP